MANKKYLKIIIFLLATISTNMHSNFSFFSKAFKAATSLASKSKPHSYQNNSKASNIPTTKLFDNASKYVPKNSNVIITKKISLLYDIVRNTFYPLCYHYPFRATMPNNNVKSEADSAPKLNKSFFLNKYALGILTAGASTAVVSKVLYNYFKKPITAKNLELDNAEKTPAQYAEFNNYIKKFISTLADEQLQSDEFYQYIVKLSMGDFSIAENRAIISQLTENQKIELQEIISKHVF